MINSTDAVIPSRAGWKEGVVLSDITGPSSYHLTWSPDDTSAFVSWELGDELVITAEVPPGYDAVFAPPAGWSGVAGPVSPGTHTWRLSRS